MARADVAWNSLNSTSRCFIFILLGDGIEASKLKDGNENGERFMRALKQEAEGTGSLLEEWGKGEWFKDLKCCCQLFEYQETAGKKRAKLEVSAGEGDKIYTTSNTYQYILVLYLKKNVLILGMTHKFAFIHIDHTRVWDTI